MQKPEVLFDAEQHGAPLPPDKASARLEEKHAIRLNESRLAELRMSGGGPPFIKPTERSIRYPTRLLDEWAAAHNRKPLLTSVPAKPRRREVITEAEADEAVRKLEERRRRRRVTNPDVVHHV